MTKLKKTKELSPILSAASMLLLGLLACAASLTMRASAGIWSTLPLYPVCVAAACFLPVKAWHRFLFFGGITLILNLAESTPMESIPYLLVAAGCFALVSGGIALLKQKKLKSGLLGGGLLVCYLVFAFLYMGNPFTAFGKSAALSEYIETHYGEGNHFENVRYDTTSGCYTVTAYNQRFPSETAEIFLMGDRVVDHYKELVEEQTLREQALVLTKVLREAFPGDSFTVTGVKIDGFLHDGEKFDAYRTKADPKDMHFYVELSGKPVFEKYYHGVQGYARTFAMKGTEFASVTYLCGTGLHFRVAIQPQVSDGFYVTPERIAIHTVAHPENHFYLRQYEDWNLIKRIGALTTEEE